MSTAQLDDRQHVAHNVRRYAREYRRYERRHPEIFNSIEQRRLGEELTAAMSIAPGDPPHALDLGVGSGNVTAHLLAAGARVTGADVSPHFLDFVEKRFAGQVDTFLLNGTDLREIEDSRFDLLTVYSVLHHIPDYLGALGEMARVLRPGGVLYLDHEVNEHWWESDGCLADFRAAVRRRRVERPGLWNPDRRAWQRVLEPARLVRGLRRRLDPDWENKREGDIHVYPHDHIEWDAIESRLESLGLELVKVVDYLHYRASYPEDLWREHAERGCTDMRLLVATRPAAA